MTDQPTPYAEIRNAALNLALSGVGHAIIVRIVGTEDPFFEWSCSCATSSLDLFVDFAEAAADAIYHVPEASTLVITRPANSTVTHQIRGVGAWLNLVTGDYEAKCTCGEVFSASAHDAALARLGSHLRPDPAPVPRAAGRPAHHTPGDTQ